MFDKVSFDCGKCGHENSIVVSEVPGSGSEFHVSEIYEEDDEKLFNYLLNSEQSCARCANKIKLTAEFGRLGTEP
jgi:ribosomal protein S27AE